MERGDPYRSWTAILAFFQSRRAPQRCARTGAVQRPAQGHTRLTRCEVPALAHSHEGHRPFEGHQALSDSTRGLQTTVSVHGVAAGKQLSLVWHLQSCALVPTLQTPMG